VLQKAWPGGGVAARRRAASHRTTGRCAFSTAATLTTHNDEFKAQFHKEGTLSGVVFLLEWQKTQ
jgi:hypothetical protein